MKSEQLAFGALFILVFSYFAFVQLKNPFEGFPPKQYALYSSQVKTPKGYHRYGSNLCDPQQDELPITLPDPNVGVAPLSMTTDQMMFDQVKKGSLSELGGFNLCQ